MTIYTVFFSLFWSQILNLPASLRNKIHGLDRVTPWDFFPEALINRNRVVRILLGESNSIIREQTVIKIMLDVAEICSIYILVKGPSYTAIWPAKTSY